VSLQLSKNTQ